LLQGIEENRQRLIFIDKSPDIASSNTMSEDLEQLSVLTLAEVSDCMVPTDATYPVDPQPPPRIHQRRLQYKALYHNYLPHFARSRSTFLSDKIDKLRTSDGRTKATFSLSKPSDSTSLQAAISLYTKLCQSDEVVNYATQAKLKNPDARCIYVPKRFRVSRDRLFGSMDKEDKGLRVYQLGVRSTTILPPLRGLRMRGKG